MLNNKYLQMMRNAIYGRAPQEISDFTNPATGQKVDVKRVDFIHDYHGKRGESSFGTVYEAEYQNQPFAIKKIDRIDFDDAYNRPKVSFDREMDFLKEATGWNCPNIVKFHGYIRFEKSAWLILELMNSDLLDVLHKPNFYVKLAELTPSERTCLGYMMLKDISNGLRYTHGINPESNVYMHRDIKPTNIMVKRKERRLAIIDFGSTKKIAEDELRIHSAGAGHQLYLAPECLFDPPVYNELCDIWSLGITMIRFFTGKHPIDDMTDNTSSSSNGYGRDCLIYCRITGQDLDGSKFDWPINLDHNEHGLKPEFSQLINQCVQRTAKDRPSADEIYIISRKKVDEMKIDEIERLFDKFFCE